MCICVYEVMCMCSSLYGDMCICNYLYMERGLLSIYGDM